VRIQALVVLLGVSAITLLSSGCILVDEIEHPFCGGLTVTKHLGRVFATCDVAAVVVPAGITPVMAPPNTDLRAVLMSLGKPSTVGKTENGHVSLSYDTAPARLEAVCKPFQRANSCSWELNAYPSGDESEMVTAPVREIVAMVSEQYPHDAEIVIVFVARDRPGAGVSVDYLDKRLARLLWYDPALTNDLRLPSK
jgi:hypothetical protein